MVWQDLAFFHWPVVPELLAPKLPPRISLDTFQERAWVGITPFRMTQVRPAYLPTVLGISTFPELNVRTYVMADGIPGIWFFSLDAMQWLAVRAARGLLNLPYHYAQARIATSPTEVAWESRRPDAAQPARFSAVYRPVGDPYWSEPGQLEHWLTERYCFYNVDRRGNVYRLRVDHPPWPLQAGEGEVLVNTMCEANSLPPVGGSPMVHFARGVEVWAGLPEPLLDHSS